MGASWRLRCGGRGRGLFGRCIYGLAGAVWCFMGGAGRHRHSIMGGMHFCNAVYERLFTKLYLNAPCRCGATIRTIPTPSWARWVRRQAVGWGTECGCGGGRGAGGFMHPAVGLETRPSPHDPPHIPLPPLPSFTLYPLPHHPVSFSPIQAEPSSPPSPRNPPLFRPSWTSASCLPATARHRS